MMDVASDRGFMRIWAFKAFMTTIDQLQLRSLEETSHTRATPALAAHVHLLLTALVPCHGPHLKTVL